MQAIFAYLLVIISNFCAIKEHIGENENFYLENQHQIGADRGTSEVI